MKKIVVLALLLAFVPLLAFAELGIGASAYFQSPVLVGQDVDTHELWDGGFTFGGDLRWKFLKFLQLDVPVLVNLDEVSSVGVLPNVGLALDLWILRLSAGVGPTVLFLLDDVTDPALLGFNAKANADVKLGRLSVGLSYVMALNFDDGVALDKSTGLLGANVLFWF